MKNHFEYINIDTPKVGINWTSASMSERSKKVLGLLSESRYASLLEITDCRENGQIYISFTKPIDVKDRSELLLGFERLIKDLIDPALVVWHIPQGDMSSLRRLRGVKVL